MATTAVLLNADMLSPLILLLFASVALTSGYVAYQLLWHPLAKYPGPRLAAITTAWRFYHYEEMARMLPRLHQTYGSFSIDRDSS